MLKNVPVLSEYDNGNGVCIFLKNNLCSIYQCRPDICNVEKMYRLYFKDHMTEDAYIKKNMDACEKIKTSRNFLKIFSSMTLHVIPIMLSFNHITIRRPNMAEEGIFTIAADSKKNLWFSILDGVSKLPGAIVNRKDFLEQEFSQFCDKELVDKIIAEGPINTQVDAAILNKAAEDVIGTHTALAAGLSFVSGLPGGFALAVTIPADLVQYCYHLVASAQKLAYIYGWPDMEGSDDEFFALLTVFIGIMLGVVKVNTGSKALSQLLEKQTFKRLSITVLAKTGILLLAKKVAEKIGEELFWRGYFNSAAKVVPLIGGITAGGATLFTFLPMVRKLNGELRKLVEE
jgi:hypothetical protein